MVYNAASYFAAAHQLNPATSASPHHALAAQFAAGVQAAAAAYNPINNNVMPITMFPTSYSTTNGKWGDIYRMKVAWILFSEGDGME